MSTQIDLGPVLSIPRGDWDANTTYERLNIVRHNSASWICNVATSTGVEPTDDSTDWYLQVKDTSSVSSVNGMRGDVVISTINTPGSTSDDTSIANTEWVRDRINEVSDSMQSYTDTSISTATTSILNTAAQDASNKATTAVDQALASSAARFATKESVEDLADHNASQDTIIAATRATANAAFPRTGGVITGSIELDGRAGLVTRDTDTRKDFIIKAMNPDRSDGAVLILKRSDEPGSGGVVQLSAIAADSTVATVQLYPDGRLQKNGHEVITSAGGTIGTIISSSNTFARRNVDSGELQLFGGNAWNQGGGMVLYGKNSSVTPGSIVLRAANGTNLSTVLHNPDGSFTHNGNNVLTSAGGTVEGSLVGTAGAICFVAKNPNFDCTATYSSNQFCGYDIRDKNDVRLAWMGYKKETTGGTQTFEIQHIKAGKNLSLLPNGRILYGGNDVVVLTDSWYDGVNWYRKYSDGWIEQGGITPSGTNGYKTHTLLIPFSNTNYTVILSGQSSTGNPAGAIWSKETFYPTDVSYFTYYNLAWPHKWYACGY